MEKNKHPLDKFFREELKNFTPEPSAAGKEAFMKSAAQVPDVSASRNRRFLLTILILLVAGTLSAVYFLVSPAGSPRNGEEASPQPTGTSAEATNSSPEAPAPSGSLPVASSSSSSLLSSLSSISSISPISPTSVPTSSLQETPSEHITENSSNQDIFQETQPPPAPLPVPVSPADSVSTDNPTLADSVPTEQKRKRTPVERKEQSWLFGAYYTPEWMFNTLEGDKYVNNFGLEGTFRFGRYSVRTGLGLSITRGTNELVIGYNDYLGTYRELDSI